MATTGPGRPEKGNAILKLAFSRLDIYVINEEQAIKYGFVHDNN